jgi:diguanylate cyclase (GGDEF)-like protein
MVHQKRLVEVLSELARTLGTDFPIQGILDHLVGVIVEVLPVTSAGITLISPGANSHYLAASDDAAVRYENLQTEVFEGPSLVAYDSGRSVSVPDLRTDLRFPHFGPAASAAGLGAVFSFPLRHDDLRLGALDLYLQSPGDLGPDDMAAAQTLADVAAAYLTSVQGRADAHALADHDEQSASHDFLTGLPNRQALSQRLEHASRRARRSRNDAAVLFADLDGFRLVNDTFGHETGDGLLVAVAERLSGLLRPGDTLARVAADEFVILCEDLQDASYVEVLANRIDQAFASPFDAAGNMVSITASVGIAFAGRGHELNDGLVTTADAAMYQAKRKGGAHHQIIDLREVSRATERADLERDLRTAIASKQLELHYQPVVSSSDGLITGVEALLRWTHPTYGAIPPPKLIAIAEQIGLITELGAWVLDRACRDHNRWQAMFPQRLDLAVNVSASQLMAPQFPGIVASVLTANTTDPECLILDVTEDIFIDDSERAGTALQDVKGLGVKIALDDFGTGYSSLSYLRRFPVDVLKIDQAFLVDLVADPAGTIFLTAVTDLAHALGLSVTAEGVETQQQAQAVAGVGCESSQGFYYARSMPADQIAAIINNETSPPRLPATKVPSSSPALI